MVTGTIRHLQERPLEKVEAVEKLGHLVLVDPSGTGVIGGFCIASSFDTAGEFGSLESFDSHALVAHMALGLTIRVDHVTHLCHSVIDGAGDSIGQGIGDFLVLTEVIDQHGRTEAYKSFQNWRW